MKALGRTLALVFAASLALAGTAQAAPARPVVVELYTSQGCSSCPPADALLGKLAQRPDVLAMSLPITYWDMLGWKDTLATEENTRRQKAYAAAMGRGGIYTPQMIIDGVTDVVGSKAANVEAAIANRLWAIQNNAVTMVAARALAGSSRSAEATAAAAPAPPSSIDPVIPVAVTQTPEELHIAIGAAGGDAHDNATVWMFHLRGAVTVAIPSGENEGRSITYRNVVGAVKPIGVWKGKPLTVTLPLAAMNGLPHDALAVIVQRNGYGHVLGAAYVTHTDHYAQQ